MKAWWPGSLAPKKGYMRNSAKPGLLPDPKVHAAYALYTSKYLSAYKAAGINISRVTVQNEPDSADHMFPVAYPACNRGGRVPARPPRAAPPRRPPRRGALRHRWRSW